MLLYLISAALLLFIVALIYANRKQARVTAAFGAPEPEIELSYKPAVLPAADRGPALPAQPRDPGLARLTRRQLVVEVLKECFDPEIPLNIVDLGLIYDVQAGNGTTTVRMSLTAPGCPSGQEIMQDIRARLEEAGFPNPKVELVWEPLWNAHYISEDGRKTLGL